MYRPTEELIPIEQTYPYLCGMLRGQLERAIREIAEVIEDWEWQSGEDSPPEYLKMALKHGKEAIRKYEKALKDREESVKKLLEVKP